MVRNSKQQWIYGAVVKVGFLSLRVLGIASDGSYTLESLDSARRYSFTPWSGLCRI